APAARVVVLRRPVEPRAEQEGVRVVRLGDEIDRDDLPGGGGELPLLRVGALGGEEHVAPDERVLNGGAGRDRAFGRRGLPQPLRGQVGGRQSQRDRQRADSPSGRVWLHVV